MYIISGVMEKSVSGELSTLRLAQLRTAAVTPQWAGGKREKTQPQTKGSYCMLRRKINKKSSLFYFETGDVPTADNCTQTEGMERMA